MIFYKDLWDCYQGQGKSADQYVPNNDPRYNCETNFGSSPLLFSKVANGATQVKDILVAFVTHPEKSTACTP